MITFLTGASSGIGQALAPLFARDGDALALVGRRRDPLEELAAAIRKSGGKALPIVCDVTDREAVHAAVRSCEEELGAVERLVASAGIRSGAYAGRFDAARFEAVMRTNYLGMVYCIEAVLPNMLRANAGQIAGIGSIAGVGGVPGTGAYSASKAAQMILLESLRIELRKTGVKVTIVSPGFIRTPMTEGNKFPMPFLMDLDKAARIIHKAIRSGARHRMFPWPFAVFAKIGRIVPSALYDWSFGLTGLSMTPENEKEEKE